MSLLEKIMGSIGEVNEEATRTARRKLDAKTKPRQSLGELEILACRLAGIFGNPAPPLPKKAIVVMAADHGVTQEGVSAYPAEVTAQMIRNFAQGGAAINVLARMAHADVVVVDMGTRKFPAAFHKGIRDFRRGPGTANFVDGPAMSRAVAIQTLEIGIGLAFELAEQGFGLCGVGEMGIGNSTSASAVTASLLRLPPAQVTGRGTGIDDDRWRKKIQVINKGLAVNLPDPSDPVDVLAKVGGFEIGGLTGFLLGAAARKIAVLLDGFITGAAAILAAGLAPAARNYWIASHRSMEPGHGAILQHLDLQPLLDLHMRLGEGTGAALAMNLVDASLCILNEMATFSGAGVTDSGA